MSGVGAVGATGGAGVTPSSGATDAAEVTRASSSGQTKAASGSEAIGAGGAESHICFHNENMSTQNFIELHNAAISQVSEPQSSEVDLKKLIEMMIAIELLKALGEQ